MYRKRDIRRVVFPGTLYCYAAMKFSTLLCVLAAGVGLTAQRSEAGVDLNPIGTFTTTPPIEEGAAEIVAHDPITQRLFVINSIAARIDVINIANPRKPKSDGFLHVKRFGAVANSVAVRDGIIAVAVEGEKKTDRGSAVFFNNDLRFIAAVKVGHLPDMITFTPDGRFALTANEGEPSDDYSIDPAGSVSVIRLPDVIGDLRQDDVREAGFGRFNKNNIPAGVRITGPEGTTVEQDIEPEYLAISHNSRTAWVTLEENNALAVVDIPSAKVKRLVPLKTKAHSAPGNGIDASNEDGRIRIKNWPVSGLYMPDGIATFRARGKEFLILANEGDSREWGNYIDETRVEEVVLNPRIFPDAASLQLPQNLGRLKISAVDGVGPDGSFHRLFSFGARSFSVRTTTGELIWDSGDDLERITAEACPKNFNASHDDNEFDDRSDDKGPEPENLTVGEAYGQPYVFVALERIGGVVTYNLSNPRHPKFANYSNNRNFNGEIGTPAAGDLGPEGIIFIKAENSPNGKPLVVTANEISGTTTVYQVNKK